MLYTQLALKLKFSVDLNLGNRDRKSMNSRNINEQKQICVQDLLAKKKAYEQSPFTSVANQTVPKAEKFLHKIPASVLSNLAGAGLGSFLTTEEACILLKCSKATLFNYKKQGILEPWQRKSRGLTRWSFDELKKITGLN